MCIYLDIYISFCRTRAAVHCTGLRSLLFLVPKMSRLKDKKKRVPNKARESLFSTTLFQGHVEASAE